MMVVTMLPASAFVAKAAANKEVVGYSTVPTDTMLVLDVSGSMDDSKSVPDMVEAANDAIKRLQELNKSNRVGVVLYSGNTSFGTSNTSTATVLLPLGRYKANNAGLFLKCDGNAGEY